MQIKCYDCGLEGDANTFVEQGWQNQPTPGITMRFWCPQCTCASPKLGPATLWSGDKVPWPQPKWELVETDQGVCVRANRFTSLMVPNHQLLKAPASLLRPELEGTMLDHTKRLQLDGKTRSAAFHAEINAWQVTNPAPQNNTHAYIDWQAAYKAFVDITREENGVGPHYTEVVHDGPTVMRKAGFRRAA